MRKMLLTSVAVFPLLTVGLWPAVSQEAKQKQQPGVSQSQGTGGAQQKGAQSPNMRGAQSQSQGAAKGPGAQQRTEGRAQPGQTGNAQERTEGRAQQGQAGNEKNAGQQPGNEKNVGQAGQNTRERGKSTTQTRGAQSEPKQNQGKNPSQTTTGQSERNQKNANGRNQENQQPSRNAAGQPKQPQPSTTGQNQRPQQNTTEQNQRTPQNATPSNQQTGQTTNRGETGSARGNVTLTQEQRTKIQQDVMSGRDVPRENRVDFSVNVGAEVPRRVRVVTVPTTLIDIHPEWRGDEYFVARDEIYIVDRDRRIVATVPVGSERSSVGTSTSTASSGNSAEIREVQQVLIDQGFYHGRADGIMGHETMQALMEFQRKQGIQATGRIDERTMSSLGVSGRTEGQGGTGPNQPGNANAPGQNRPGQGNPGATNGQGGNQPSANPGARPNNQGSNPGQGPNQKPPTTSGQGGNQGSKNPGAGPSNGQQPAQPSQGQPSKEKQR